MTANKLVFPRHSLLVLLLAIFVGCQKNEPSDIHYTISPEVRDSVSLIKVQLEFEPDVTGITKVRYDDDAWGQEDLFNALQDVRLVSPHGAAIEINKDSSWIQINHNRKNGPLVLEYFLKQDFSLEEQPTESYRPIIQPQYFHLFSHNFFMVPESWVSDSKATRKVFLSWEGFPADYIIHNSFGSQERAQQLNDIALEDFHSAIFVGGDYQLREGDIKGNRVVLAVRGEWIPFDETEVFEVLMQTLRAQRTFWEDHSQPYFTVTLRPLIVEGGSSFQGTGLTNSFACSISNNEETEISQLIYLFNHELQHNWTGRTIQNANEEEQYWFSEGFTDYYTWKNISKYKIGGIDESFFIDQLNEAIRNLYSSPVFDAPNSEINYDNFWANPDYGKLPYYRGAVYAFLVDNWIINKTNGKRSLDDLMLELLQAANKEGVKISNSYWMMKLEAVLGSESGRFFEKYMEEGNPIPLAELLAGMGYQAQPSSEAFNLGFELGEDQRLVVSVEEESAAYRAGIRKGDRFKTYSIEFGNISRPVTGVVFRDGQELPIEYMPVKEIAIPKILNNQHNLDMVRRLQ